MGRSNGCTADKFGSARLKAVMSLAPMRSFDNYDQSREPFAGHDSVAGGTGERHVLGRSAGSGCRPRVGVDSGRHRDRQRYNTAGPGHNLCKL